MKSKHIGYKGTRLFIEDVPAFRLVKELGSPLYVYSTRDLQDRLRSYESAFTTINNLICYSMKANSSLALSRLLARMGAGADVVSGGELKKALLAGFRPQNIIFSGVGKTREELTLAVRKKIRFINVESEEELRALSEVARSLKVAAPFSLRVNPDVKAGGHAHISTGTPKNKFGVFHKNIFPLYAWAHRQPYLKPVGIQAHIGSQITQIAPYKRALAVVLNLIDKLEAAGVRLEVIDLGGGLGVNYDQESVDTPRQLADAILPSLHNRELMLILEPGRSLVAQAGVLLTSVLYRKTGGGKTFVIVDAAMNDLARPALYDAYHDVLPLQRRAGERQPVDLVGPICESGDYLARDRSLVLPRQNDILAILTAGAYGFSMSSQYNSRPRAAEVLVKGDQFDVIRKRESFVDLIRGEVIPASLVDR